MPSLFAFQGRIGRLPYASRSLGVLGTQHLVVLLGFAAEGRAPDLDWRFFLMPLRSLGALQSNGLLVLACGLLVVAASALAALSFRRVADADLSPWIAVLAIVPWGQLPLVAALSLAPPADAAGQRRVASTASARDWAAAAQGVLAGIGLTLFAVAVGALIFGVYGFAMFVASPFVIGAATAFLANRERDLGGAQTMVLVAVAAMLGSLALVAVALEGVVCIVLASPLAVFVAAIGGVFGRSAARYTRRSTTRTLSALALLPALFASESILPATTIFDTSQTIAIAAPPPAVWRSIVRMDALDEPLGLPFRLGVAYPLRGEVLGEGVGALRRGEFSTGVAVERVTEWIPDRRLAFVIVTDVPAMREMSPYRHVHAPHVMGYFRTTQTSFELVPRADGGTDVIERTSHAIKLEPAFYWLPMARWVVAQNNARVLAHIRRQAERSILAGG